MALAVQMGRDAAEEIDVNEVVGDDLVGQCAGVVVGGVGSGDGVVKVPDEQPWFTATQCLIKTTGSGCPVANSLFRRTING